MEPALAERQARARELDDAGVTRAPRASGAVLRKLKQQDLDSYTVTFSPRAVISLYFALALVFLPVGVAVVAATARIESSGRQTYTDQASCRERAPGEDPTEDCIIELTFANTVHPPSYMYYSLSNFYQNARKYAKSRSDTMNQGILPKTQFDVETCDPYLYRPDADRDGPFDPANFIYPCGLTARSFFNDTFELCEDIQCETQVPLSKEGIAWSTDLDHKFVPGEDDLFERQVPEFPEGTTANSLFDDEDFVVWMRLSAFPRFDKLYRIINQPLEANRTYYVKVHPNFPVEQFAGTKAFYISNMSWLGGPNVFLGTAYLIVGMVALFIAVTLLVKHIRNPRPPAYLDPEVFMRELAKLSGDYRPPDTTPLQ